MEMEIMAHSQAKRSNSGSTWMLFVLASIHLVASLAHFLITVVSKSVAEDIHYGTQACVPVSTTSAGVQNISHATCSSFNNSISCGSVRDDNDDEIYDCEWRYTGLGLEYQLLVGPSFMAVFTLTSIGWGVLADRYNRVNLLVTSTVLFSLSMIFTAFFATRFWHLVLLRMTLAAGVSALVPIAPGLIYDSFTEKHRALAMSFFHWGIYLGGGLSNTVGKNVSDLHIFTQGWRGAFLVSGIPGLVLAMLMFSTGEDPPKTQSKSDYRVKKPAKKLELKVQEHEPTTTDMEEEQDIIEYEESEAQVLIETNNGSINNSDSTSAWRLCLHPPVVILGLGACIRQAAGYTWGYNAALYFQNYYPGFDASWWLTWITIFGGSIGVVVGGFVSDRLVARLGLSARALVLAASQLFAVPFALGTLWLDPPSSFLSLLVGFLFAEMWYGVVFAILVELLPTSIRSLGMAVMLFIINNVGGNLPVLVTPLSSILTYRGALAVLYPGSLLASSFLFFIAFVALLNK